MTRQKTFKRRVRERMAKTGESYTAARRMLIADGDRPDAAVAGVRAAGGRGAGRRGDRPRLAGVVRAARRVGRARAAPTPRSRAGCATSTGSTAGTRSRSRSATSEPAASARRASMPTGSRSRATRTVGVPVERLFDSFEDQALRERWLPGAELRTRTATAPRSARYDWEDGSTRVIVGFDDLGDEQEPRGALARAAPRCRDGRRDEGLVARAPHGAQVAARGR